MFTFLCLLRGRLRVVICAVLSARRRLPIYSDKQTFPESGGVSQRCHKQTHAPQQLAILFNSLARSIFKGVPRNSSCSRLLVCETLRRDALLVWAAGMSKPFDLDRYRRLLAEAKDEPKRLALIRLRHVSYRHSSRVFNPAPALAFFVDVRRSLQSCSWNCLYATH